MNLNNRYPGLVNVPTDVTTQQSQWMQQVTTTLRSGIGQNGQQDKWLTWNDLERNRVVTRSTQPGGGYEPSYPTPPPDLSAPGKLTGVTAYGGLTVNYIEWKNPELNYYYHIEVHRSATNNVTTAVLVGTTMGTLYNDVLGSDTHQYYYWVRIVKSSSGKHVFGPWHNTLGVSAQAKPDPKWLLDQISGKFDTGDLATQVFNVDLFGVKAKDKTVSQFAFAVDTTVTPNIVAINGASIVKASIKDAAIATLNVNKLVGKTATWVNANILDGSIVNAKIGNIIQSSNYITGKDGWMINKNGLMEIFNLVARGIIKGSVIEGSLIAGTMFINPEKESMVPTEADTGKYPRYLTFTTDYTYTKGSTAYSGQETPIAGQSGWVRSVKSPVIVCPIKACDFTGAGHSKNIYFNQKRFQKYKPWILIETSDVNTSGVTSNWCSGPRGADDEPRHMRAVRVYATIYCTGQKNIDLKFESGLTLWNCGGNDGHQWPDNANFTKTVNGFELFFRYGVKHTHNIGCHGYNQRFFTFRIQGRLPYRFSGSGKISARIYFEWQNARGTVAHEKSLIRNLKVGGKTRT